MAYPVYYDDDDDDDVNNECIFDIIRNEIQMTDTCSDIGNGSTCQREKVRVVKSWSGDGSAMGAIKRTNQSIAKTGGFSLTARNAENSRDAHLQQNT